MDEDWFLGVAGFVGGGVWLLGGVRGGDVAVGGGAEEDECGGWLVRGEGDELCGGWERGDGCAGGCDCDGGCERGEGFTGGWDCGFALGVVGFWTAGAGAGAGAGLRGVVEAGGAGPGLTTLLGEVEQHKNPLLFFAGFFVGGISRKEDLFETGACSIACVGCGSTSCLITGLVGSTFETGISRTTSPSSSDFENLWGQCQ